MAPHLSDHIHRETFEDESDVIGDPEDSGTVTGDGSSSTPGLSAAAFVHYTHGSAQQSRTRPTTTTTTSTTTASTTDGITANAARLSLSRDRSQKESGGRSAERSSGLRDRDGQEWWGAARPHLFSFVAKYLELSLVSVGPRLTSAVLISVTESARAMGAIVGLGVGAVGGGGMASTSHDAQARRVCCRCFSFRSLKIQKITKLRLFSPKKKIRFLLSPDFCMFLRPLFELDGNWCLRFGGFSACTRSRRFQCCLKVIKKSLAFRFPQSSEPAVTQLCVDRLVFSSMDAVLEGRSSSTKCCPTFSSRR